MCNLGIQKTFSQLMISKSLSPEQLALKKKNDQRAFALLKAIAATQISSSQDLSAYPRLASALSENKSK